MLKSLMGVLFKRGKPDKERRRLPIAGASPSVGSAITRRQVLMRVTHPIPQDLWDWLVLMGWREIAVRQERRRYRRLPDAALTRLVHANQAERESIYQDMMGA